MLKTLSSIRLGMRRMIGNGRTTSCLMDPWLFNIPLIWLPTFVSTEIQMQDLSVAHFMLNGCWNIDLLDLCFGPELVASIFDIHIPLLPGDDQRVWIGDPKGIPSAKSVYRMLNMPAYLNNHANRPEWRGWKIIWDIPVVPKVHNFLWKLLHGRLPTKSFISHFDPSYSNCSFCGMHAENIAHLFFH